MFLFSWTRKLLSGGARKEGPLVRDWVAFPDRQAIGLAGSEPFETNVKTVTGYMPKSHHHKQQISIRHS